VLKLLPKSLCLIVALICTFGGFSFAGADDNPVVAKIGAQVITENDLKDLANSMPERFRQIYMTPEGRQKTIEYIVDIYVLSAEAEKQGMDKSPEIAKLLQFSKRDLLARKYLDKYSKEAPAATEAEAKEFYEKNKSEFMQPETIHLHHILVKTEKEAKDAQDRLKKGAKFAEVASEVSLCPSKTKGGNLDWLPRGSLVKEIDDVAFGTDIKPGVPFGPVQSKFGYHILLLEEKKPPQETPFEQVKDFVTEQVKFKKQQDQYEDITKALKKNAKVEIPAPEAIPAGPAK
jgi:peptidyl-prolyl cis-trans isomerase C